MQLPFPLLIGFTAGLNVGLFSQDKSVYQERCRRMRLKRLRNKFTFCVTLEINHMEQKMTDAALYFSSRTEHKAISEGHCTFGVQSHSLTM